MKGLLVLLVMLIAGDLAAAEDPRRAHSAAIAERFQKELGERLAGALAAGGPVAAIAVCQQEAPGIAARLSTETGARVGRTALRVRNPANAPDASAREVLERFAQAVASGTSAPREHFAVAPDGQARYYKAIITQPQCLSCHGPALDPTVAKAIARHYPNDRATGFAAGELRGAFVVEWPAAGGEGP